MELVNGFDLMKYAKRYGYILPAFNTTNMETTLGIVKGLNRAKLPGYIQISSSNLKLSGSDPLIIANIARRANMDGEVPIALHLDHGKSFQDIKACCNAGFTSIMVDNASLPYEQNAEESRKASDYCHFYGVPVEVELGAIKGKEEDLVSESNDMTDPDQAADFINRTNCDLLAVSVGNVHGLDLEPHIDLALLENIYKKSTVPLVLHGGSGIPKEMIWEARRFGLIKINYGSALRKAYISTFGKVYEEDKNAHDLVTVCKSAVEQVSEVVFELVTMINDRK